MLEGNPAARELLGADSVGRLWSEIEAQRLAATATPQEWQLRDAAGDPQQRWVSIDGEPARSRRAGVFC